MKTISLVGCIMIIVSSSLSWAGVPSTELQCYFSILKGSQHVAAPLITAPVERTAFHLDDGTVGVLKVEQLDERTHGQIVGEDYLLTAYDASGKQLGHIELAAAYEEFQMTHCDIVGGAGDEIVWVSQEGHSSPFPQDMTLRVFSLGAKGFFEAGHFVVSGYVTGCSMWWDEARVDVSHKPASIQLVRHTEPCPGETVINDPSFAVEATVLEWSQADKQFIAKRIIKKNTIKSGT